MRLQPIVTTYASSFIFTGIALYILPRPGGKLPADLPRLYRSTPGNIPFAVYVIIGIILFWLLVRSIRYGQYLFAVGDKPDAAYATGIPVSRVRWSTYALSGISAALAIGHREIRLSGHGTRRITTADRKHRHPDRKQLQPCNHVQ